MYLLNFPSKYLSFSSRNLLIVILFVLFIMNNAIYANSNKLLELRDSVNKYYYTFNLKGLKNTLNEIEQYNNKEKNNYYGFYYNGIIRYCIGRVVYNTNRDVAYNYFDTALNMFEKAYEIEKNPVSLAMISASLGKKAALSPLKSLYFGQISKNKIYEANNLSPNNPKILLVAATHLMHIPAIYGGDKKKARLLLEKCLELNKKENIKNEYELDWADDSEIFAYLAQIDILENNIDNARKNMQKSLNLKPRYGFVTIDLEKQISEIKN